MNITRRAFVWVASLALPAVAWWTPRDRWMDRIMEHVQRHVWPTGMRWTHAEDADMQRHVLQGRFAVNGQPFGISAVFPYGDVGDELRAAMVANVNRSVWDIIAEHESIGARERATVTRS